MRLGPTTARTGDRATMQRCQLRPSFLSTFNFKKLTLPQKSPLALVEIRFESQMLEGF